MGKIYEKDGHLYEEGAWIDKDLGKLHQNLDGTRETRNMFGEDYNVGRENFSRESTVSTSSGETGRMVYDFWNERREYRPSPKNSDYSNSGYSTGETGDYSTTYRTDSRSSKNKEEFNWGGFFVFVGDISGMLGFTSFAKRVYSRASEAFIIQGDMRLSAHYAEKSGNYRDAMQRYVVAGDTDTAVRLAYEHLKGEELVGFLRENRRYADAAEASLTQGKVEESIELYRRAGRNGDRYHQMNMLKEAARIAAAAGNDSTLLSIYEEGAGYYRALSYRSLNNLGRYDTSAMIMSEDMNRQAKLLKEKMQKS